jgi:hypothetical protein
MRSDDICDKLDTLIDVNRETQQWLKLLALDQVGDSVEQVIGDNPANYELYESLDGETPLSELTDGIDMSKRTAYRRLNDWQRIGVVTRVSRGEYDKIASPETLGIESPRDSE